PVGIEKLGVKTTTDLDEALKDADCVNVLRMQLERDENTAFPSSLEYFKQYGITTERLQKQKKKILIMHPGPLNRGVEISSEVADGENSIILEQVTNGIAIRMAVLYLVSQAKERIPR
ncbi:MAG: aspartate carbamoyltransferase, partial [Candidatus Omnitrophica bacterium]|nr:aspartate carbamoyltransferase [Candidatus Omnitrophota bacterium]